MRKVAPRLELSSWTPQPCLASTSPLSRCSTACPPTSSTAASGCTSLARSTSTRLTASDWHHQRRHRRTPHGRRGRGCDTSRLRPPAEHRPQVGL